MKKIFTFLLIIMMTAGITACTGSSDKETTAQTAGETIESAADDTTAETNEDEKANDTTSGKLIMATEAGFAPYEYTEDGETVVGVDVDIANEIAKAMGLELEIQNMSFDGALIAVQQGKADFAAAGISVTPEREEMMDFSIEYATSKQVVVINKNAGRVAAVTDINAETAIGVQAGTVADYYCQDEGLNGNQYNKYMEAAMELKNDKIDCIIMDALPAEQMVEANDDLEILDGEVFTDRYAIAVQKGNTELLDQINTVLEQLIEEGKIEEYTINHTTK